MMHNSKRPPPLQEPYQIGDGQWMVPCVIEDFQRKFTPLCRPPKLTADPSLKAPWTIEEDELLKTLTLLKGVKKWTAISKELNKALHRGKQHRHGKQCRERWFNHLNPDLKKADWTRDEDQTILSLQEQWGNRWSFIAKELPGRTENAVKNRWKSMTRKKGPPHFSEGSSDSVDSVIPLALQSAGYPSHCSLQSSPVKDLDELFFWKYPLDDGRQGSIEYA